MPASPASRPPMPVRRRAWSTPPTSWERRWAWPCCPLSPSAPEPGSPGPAAVAEHVRAALTGSSVLLAVALVVVLVFIVPAGQPAAAERRRRGRVGRRGGRL